MNIQILSTMSDVPFTQSPLCLREHTSSRMQKQCVTVTHCFLVYLKIKITFKNRMRVKTLSKVLGHSSVGFTLDTYAHVTEQLKAEEMAGLNRFLK